MQNIFISGITLYKTKYSQNCEQRDHPRERERQIVVFIDKCSLFGSFFVLCTVINKVFSEHGF